MWPIFHSFGNKRPQRLLSIGRVFRKYSVHFDKSHGTHSGWNSWFSGRRERGNLAFWFEGRLSITWREMSSVELVWVRGVMHTLFWKVPSMGSWTFQFKLYTPPRKSRHLHPIFSKAVRTPPQYSQPHRLCSQLQRAQSLLPVTTPRV